MSSLNHWRMGPRPWVHGCGGWLWALAVVLVSGLAGVLPGQGAVLAQEAAVEGADEAEAAADNPRHPFQRRIPSPPLSGGGEWFNTAQPLDLPQLRGKFVLLDFWTYCCINCMHILPELKKLEQAFPNELVVIGVHSAKFETEQDAGNIREAVLRYQIEHPVVNDADHTLWNRFEVMSWPSLRVIDPEGNLVAGHSGEIQFADLKPFFDAALPYYRQRGLLNTTPMKFELESQREADTPLRFPGKVLADEASGRLFIADSNHHRLLATDFEGRVQAVIGSGQQGRADGSFEAAQLNQPQGMALVGDVLYVADTENHLIRAADLKTRQVRTVAGTGEATHDPWPGRSGGGRRRFVGPPLETALSSPWSLYVHDKSLYIAMAGPHQIWKLPLDESEIGPYAGNGREDIVDGPLLPSEPFATGAASFAQPSELSGDEKWLYVADSEGSSIRAVPFDPAGKVRTVVGTSHLRGGRLFAFGDVDGKGKEVRLQHVLGVVYYRGKLYLADTYNNKVKEVDLEGPAVRTLAGSGKAGRGDDPAEFDEPAGITAAAGKLFVADTNNHAVRVIDLEAGGKVSTLVVSGLPGE